MPRCNELMVGCRVNGCGGILYKFTCMQPIKGKARKRMKSICTNKRPWHSPKQFSTCYSLFHLVSEYPTHQLQTCCAQSIYIWRVRQCLEHINTGYALFISSYFSLIPLLFVICCMFIFFQQFIFFYFYTALLCFTRNILRFLVFSTLSGIAFLVV